MGGGGGGGRGGSIAPTYKYLSYSCAVKGHDVERTT